MLGAIRIRQTHARAIAFGLSVLACSSEAFAAADPPHGVSPAVAPAVADSSRPESDTARDADRKPAQTIIFSGVKPGDRVADYVADSGYFTRLFSIIVGPKGHVYAVEPTAFFGFRVFPQRSLSSKAIQWRIRT